MNKPLSFYVLAWVCLALLGATANSAMADAAPLTVNALFSDGAVLQRSVDVPVWGTAEPGQSVRVSLLGQSVEATADAEGRWEARLAPLEAGGPHVIKITDGKKSILIKDVLVGDVWLCSGQSNMQFVMKATHEYEQELKTANYPQLRQFKVRALPNTQQLSNSPEGQWLACSPDTLHQFSGVAYYMGRDLHRQLDVPIGLINASLAATMIEAWMSRPSLESSDEFRPILERYDEAMRLYPKKQEEFLHLTKLAKTAFRASDVAFTDPGETDPSQWAAPDVDDTGWEVLPDYHVQLKWPGDSVVWARKKIKISNAQAGHAMVIDRVNARRPESITAYFNGQRIELNENRGIIWSFKVPAELVTEGEALFAVRIYTDKRDVTFWTYPQLLKTEASGVKTLFATEPWHFKATASAEDRAVPILAKAITPMGPYSTKAPTALFNGMIAPVIPYAIKGVAWYQGESNANRAIQYRSLLATMINDWRGHWSDDALPFLIVQLANYKAPRPAPAQSTWAELRDAQLHVANNTGHTRLIVTIDLGDAKDVHPRNKRDVGTRLALTARELVHGESIISQGPMYRDMKVRGNAIAISFDHIGDGLIAKGDGPLQRFAIAGADKKFQWANAIIEGDTVVVSHPQVPQPVAVRYGWEENPEGCKLYNAQGLPASPFRTDDWPGLTDAKK